MKTILTISPHLDDAAFSVGPLLADLAGEARLVVVTPFTGSVVSPKGFALSCQLDKGLASDADYMRIRREEDALWTEHFGLTFVHGPFLEAPHRGYNQAKELFGPFNPVDFVSQDLESWLRNFSDEINPDIILLPLGVGRHVDHRRVRDAAEKAIGGSRHLEYFQDQPYTVKTGSIESGRAPFEAVGLHAHRVLVSEDAIMRALSACESYRTQIPFQFGGINEMRTLLESAWVDGLPIFSKVETSEILNIPASNPNR